MNKDELKRALDELGLTQAELARELSERSGQKVFRQNIWRLFAGTRAIGAYLAAYISLRLEVHRKEQAQKKAAP